LTTDPCDDGPMPPSADRAASALIVQWPETQVPGVRVRDDVVWGLPTRPIVPIVGRNVR
jgi:hypothetical protein